MKAYKGGKSGSNQGNIDPNLLRVIETGKKEGRNIIVNPSDRKYSAMLLELVEPYHEPLSKVEQLEWLLDIGVLAWNIANIKKAGPDEYHSLMADARKVFNNDQEAFQVLEKLIIAKEEKFDEEDMFIESFTVGENETGAFLTVTAMPIESFMMNFFDEEEDEELDELNYMPGYINRIAISVVPKQPFTDWIKSLSERYLVNDTSSHIYLVEKYIDDSKRTKWLKKNFDKLFKRELGHWSTNKKSWPQKRTYDMFNDWFEIKYHSKLFDLEDYPVDKEGIIEI